MGRVAIFIDAAYLRKTLEKEFNAAKIDFGKLATRLADGQEILRTYYYDCEPYQSNPPTLDETQRFSKAQRFHHALNQIRRFQVRLGKLVFRGTDANGMPILHQKRVDIQMGVDLVLLAAKNHISDAIIVAGDSDFIPAIDAAKPEGVVIHLFNGERPHRDLVSRCDERTRIDQALIDAVKMGPPGP
ncbi:MAG: NYN domain-containing protein [Pirellulaceae bacterium]